MLIVTHEVEFVRQAADRALLMVEGTAVEEGSPEQIFSNPTNERTRRFFKGSIG